MLPIISAERAATTLDNAQNARTSELVGKGVDFSEATRQAAQETAQKYGLAYYQGTGGILDRVYP